MQATKAEGHVMALPSARSFAIAPEIKLKIAM
jgi:hypothetical protein